METRQRKKETLKNKIPKYRDFDKVLPFCKAHSPQCPTSSSEGYKFGLIGRPKESQVELSSSEVDSLWTFSIYRIFLEAKISK